MRSHSPHNYHSLWLHGKKKGDTFNSTSQTPSQTIAPLHKITQGFLHEQSCTLSNAIVVASSNTAFTPSPVFDEHSMYAFRFNSLAAFIPSCSVRGCLPALSHSFRLVPSSSRRSFLHAINTTGRPGQKCFTSCIHFSYTFCSESGESILIQISTMCESG